MWLTLQLNSILLPIHTWEVWSKQKDVSQGALHGRPERDQTPLQSLQDICHCSVEPTDPGGGGRHLYLKLDIILVKKFHMIRVVFQDQAMYASKSFTGSKSCKIWKRVCFCQFYQFWKEHDGKLKEKTGNYGLFLYLETMCLRCVLKVLLRGWYPPWNTSSPPPGPLVITFCKLGSDYSAISESLHVYASTSFMGLGLRASLIQHSVKCTLASL